MRYFKEHLLIISAVFLLIALGVFLWVINWSPLQAKSTETAIVSVNESIDVGSAPAAPVNTIKNNTATLPTPVTASSQQAQFCPQPEKLIKKDVKWTTEDAKWENYTPSSATKILGFIGAQWAGIKVGTIICLYQTNEAVSFPVALEQTRSQLIVEPKAGGWSSLVGNRRFCKSASVADCVYFIELPKDISNIYEEIKYDPKTNDGM